MRVVFMGSPEFSLPSLEYLMLNRYQVVTVYTQPDRPAGRGRALVLPPLKRVALSLELPVMQPASLKAPEAVAQLADLHPDVIIVAAFGQILPQSVLDIPEYGCINIHPSLLPRYRGASPVAAAILAGDEFTGVTIMLMAAGLDTGPILARAMVSISTQDTTGSLTEKLSLISAHLLLDVLPRWVKGEIAPRPQDEAGATYTGVISKEDGRINWQMPAVEIWRRVRAFQPWPGCFTELQEKRLEIIQAMPLPAEEGLEVGRVSARSCLAGSLEVAFGVGTGNGVLGVASVRLEGKRAMPADEFLRGQRQFIGAMLATD